MLDSEAFNQAVESFANFHMQDSNDYYADHTIDAFIAELDAIYFTAKSIDED